MGLDLSTGGLVGAWKARRNVVRNGGWMTRARIADDETIMMGSDVAGPWFLTPGATEWVKLFRPGDNYDLSDQEYLEAGAWEVGICATNSDYMYWVMSGWTWMTPDRGVTVVRCNLPRLSDVGPNDGAVRALGNMIAVDPRDPLHVIIATPIGLRRTIDGGANWTSISTGTVPAPSGGVRRRGCVVFDRSSAASGGRTSVCRAMIPGSGLHSSSDTGATWGAAAAATTGFLPAHMVIDETTGRIHLSGFSDDIESGTPGASQYRYSTDGGATWTSPAGVEGKVVVLSLENPGHIYLITGGGDYRFSSDTGGTWGPHTKTAFNAVVAEYLNMTDASGFKSNGYALFSRNHNRWYMFEGVSCWFIDNPPTNSSLITLTDFGLGAENMIITLTAIFGDGYRGHAVHDKCGFILAPGQVGKSSAKRTALTGLFTHGGQIAQAPGNPNFYVMCSFYDKKFTEGPNAGKFMDMNRGGWTSDKGLNWNLFENHIADDLDGYGGGNIICFDENVIIQRQTSNGKIGWTKDRAQTPWQDLVISNGKVTRGHFAYRVSHVVLVADPHHPNQALLYMCDDNGVELEGGYTQEDLEDVRGIWRITWNPETETMSTVRIRPTWIINNTDYNHGQLVPFGPDQWLWFAQDGSAGVYRSIDGGVTWTQIAFQSSGYGTAYFGTVFAVAVGKPLIEGGPNSLLVFGWRDPARLGDGDYSSWGAWLSVDGDAISPKLERVSQWVGSSHHLQTSAAGNPAQFGDFDLGGSEGVVNLYFTDERVGR